jgi:hypothetical protein
VADASMTYEDAVAKVTEALTTLDRPSLPLHDVVAATKAGRYYLDVATRRLDEACRELSIEVHDSGDGPGVPAAPAPAGRDIDPDDIPF